MGMKLFWWVLVGYEAARGCWVDGGGTGQSLIWLWWWWVAANMVGQSVRVAITGAEQGKEKVGDAYVGEGQISE